MVLLVPVTSMSKETVNKNDTLHLFLSHSRDLPPTRSTPCSCLLRPRESHTQFVMLRQTSTMQTSIIRTKEKIADTMNSFCLSTILAHVHYVVVEIFLEIYAWPSLQVLLPRVMAVLAQWCIFGALKRSTC